MRRRPRVASRPPLPLAAWAGLAAMALGVAVAAAVLAGLSLGGRADAGQVLLAAACGLGVTTALAVGAALLAGRAADALRGLRAEAERRLLDPAAAPSAAPRSIVGGALELAELARTLDALHLRVRAADAAAEEQRRLAETAGAGTFELLAGLVDAEERARGQLAAELHDTVAQSLVVASRLLDEGRGAQAADYVADAEEQVRALMARTRPPALAGHDLATAVRGLVADLRQRYALAVGLSWPSRSAPLPMPTAVTAYRFFQEALLNVVKHADVDAASAGLIVHDEAIELWVADEGPGFDVTAALAGGPGGRHVGLGLLRERARLAGGTLSVDCPPSGGTRLVLRLPVPARAAFAAAAAPVIPAQAGAGEDVGQSEGARSDAAPAAQYGDAGHLGR